MLGKSASVLQTVAQFLSGRQLGSVCLAYAVESIEVLPGTK